MENDQLNDKIAQVEARYKFLFSDMEGDRFNQHNIHRMHVKLLGIRNLEEVMQKIVNRRRQCCIE
jgi:hypothetical protein